MGTWLPFRRSKTASTAPLEVIIYTRASCGLCDEAQQLLVDQATRVGRSLRIQAVDIDADPELVERYNDHIPVIVIAGVERFRGRVNPVLLERLLRHESGSSL